MLKIFLRSILACIQIHLSTILQRQALGNLIGELIVIRIVRVIVVSDSTVEVERYVLPNMGVARIELIIALGAHDFLIDGRDALLGSHHFIIRAINDRIYRRGKNVLRFGIRTFRNAIGQEKPVTSGKTRKGRATRSRRMPATAVPQIGSNLVQNVVAADSSTFVGLLGACVVFVQPISGILRVIANVGSILFLDGVYDSSLDVGAGPRDVAHSRAPGGRRNRSRKDLNALIGRGRFIIRIVERHS